MIRSSTKRTRAYRARIDAGLALFVFEDNEVEVKQELQDAELLRPEDWDNQTAVAKALREYFRKARNVVPSNEDQGS
jgi:hypothetical protein